MVRFWLWVSFCGFWLPSVGQVAEKDAVISNPAWVESSDEGLLYYASVYDSLLLIDVKITDPHWHHQLLMTGLNLEVTAKGASAKQRIIRFPMGLDPANQPDDPNRLYRFLGVLTANRDQLLMTMPYAQFIGAQGKRDTVTTALPTPGGIQMVAQFQGENLLVSYEVPLDVFAGWAQAKGFSFKWKTGELPRPAQLRGQDAVGLEGNSLPDPRSPTELSFQVEWIQRLDHYRTFSSPAKARVGQHSMEDLREAGNARFGPEEN